MHHTFNPVILRAYDIRGIVGESLFAEDAYAVGRAVASYIVNEKGGSAGNVRIAVGYDGRLSSPELEAALVRGMKDTGVTVVRVGLGPTPMLYFAVRSRELDGGVMVTGSHNPPTHNGFKMMVGKRALFGEDIQLLGSMAASGETREGVGKVVEERVFEDFVKAVAGGYDAPKGRKLTIAWDAGNGAAGEVMTALSRILPGEHTLLNEKIDGHFPAHHPDPSKEENMQQLADAVRQGKCDLGLAFDGDGDRVGAVDDKGRILTAEHLMMLYAEDVLKTSPGATIIADVKTSQSLFDRIAALGGKPLIWKTGHSFIKAKMAETGAALAGEMSGHIFFADRYFGFDDGLYAAVRLVNLVAKSGKKLSELVDALPTACNTPELHIPVSEARKFRIVEEVAARLKAAGITYNDIDGVRVMHPDGWWLLRASNTQAALVGRCEAKDTKALEKMQKELEGQLRESGITVTQVAGH